MIFNKKESNQYHGSFSEGILYTRILYEGILRRLCEISELDLFLEINRLDN